MGRSSDIIKVIFIDHLLIIALQDSNLSEGKDTAEGHSLLKAPNNDWGLGVHRIEISMEEVYVGIINIPTLLSLIFFSFMQLNNAINE